MIHRGSVLRRMGSRKQDGVRKEVTRMWAQLERGFRLILWGTDNTHRMGLLKWYKEFES